MATGVLAAWTALLQRAREKAGMVAWAASVHRVSVGSLCLFLRLRKDPLYAFEPSLT